MSLTPSLRLRVRRLEQSRAAASGLLGVVLRPGPNLHAALHAIENARREGCVVYIVNFAGVR